MLRGKKGRALSIDELKNYIAYILVVWIEKKARDLHAVVPQTPHAQFNE